MLDRGDPGCRSAYLPFPAKCVQFVKKRGFSPVILLHEAVEDLIIGKTLNSEIGGAVPIIAHGDPRILKSCIKNAFLMIGSRYHALVSCRSQSVPAIAPGWTHKYEALMKQYNCPDSLVTPLDPEHEDFSIGNNEIQRESY